PQKTVVDFGGGYGVHYLTLLKTKTSITPCLWEVIELSEVAELGRQKWHRHGNIRFLESLASATQRPDLVIASGVLHLLTDPHFYLRQIESLEPAFLFIDRLPLIDGDRDACTVQKIGPAYFGVERANPLWLFSRDKFVSDLMRGFDIVFRFKGFQDAAHVAFDAEAILLRRRSSSFAKG
ncbi:MAG TPA: methyltransferase, TIGR04325 family, partial [Methylocella sp.]|nr:methyltransferase, TIGR04325 family [Methylocella sp.]